MDNTPEIECLEKILSHITKTIMLYECEDIPKQIKLIDAATTVAVQLNEFRKGFEDIKGEKEYED